MVAARLGSVVSGSGEEIDGWLVVDLVPEPCPRLNLRVELDAREWQRVERAVLAAAGGRCAMCRAGIRDGQLECEVLWSYDDAAGVQQLDRLVAVCVACCGVMNIDLAVRTGTADEALRHLATVNGWAEVEAEQHVREAFDRWQRRSRRRWMTDLTRLRDYGIELWPDRVPDADPDRSDRGSAAFLADPLVVRAIPAYDIDGPRR